VANTNFELLVVPQAAGRNRVNRQTVDKIDRPPNKAIRGVSRLNSKDVDGTEST